jgi:hypothetical protein
MEGDSAGWIALPDCGRFHVVMNPISGPGTLYGNSAVEICSSGLSGDVTRKIELKAAPAYPSSFALLSDDGIPAGYFVDGRMVNGPVHSNGEIYFSSYSPDSTDDPYVLMVSTTSDGGFFFSGTGESELPHPEGSNVWVRPYSHHQQGSPYWRTATCEIDFSRMNDYFRGLVSGSVQSSAVRINAERILVNGQSLLYKENREAEEISLNLNDVDLVIVRNGFSPVTVKTISTPNHPLTIIAVRDMEIGGTVDGGAAGSSGPMGLVALGDIVVAADPDETGGSDWPGMWAIETNRGILVRASLVAPSGGFKAEVPYLPREQTRITVTGGLAVKTMGRFSSGRSGYYVGNTWEQGLVSLHPPYFPMLGRWEVYSWIMDHPEQEE